MDGEAGWWTTSGNIGLPPLVREWVANNNSPPPALCNISVHTVVKLCTFCFGFRGELGFLNCDAVCTGVVNKQFELLKFVLMSFMLTCSMMRFL